MNKLAQVFATAALLCAPLMAGSYTARGPSKGSACYSAYEYVKGTMQENYVGECECEKVDQWECTVTYSDNDGIETDMSYDSEKTKLRACRAAVDKYERIQNFGFDHGYTTTQGSCDCEPHKGGYECIQYFTIDKKNKRK